MKPEISVIVPVYKVEKYLEKCVDSLLDQTYPNLEIILVDDGSPDGCPEICDRYAAEHANIVTYHKENGGLSSARNYGVEHTDSEWIVFVDSDDFVEQTYVEDLWNLRERFQADMAITRVVREPEGSGSKKQVHKFEDFCADRENTITQIILGTKVGWGAYSKLFRKKLLLKHPFPDGLYEDSACMYLIVNECEKVAIGDYEWNYHYIHRPGSILNTQLGSKHYRVFEIAEEVTAFLKENYPHLEILSVAFYLRAVVQMLNLQTMDRKTYRKIFCMHRSMFRKNLIRVLSDKRIGRSRKIQAMLLCTTPGMFKLQKKLLDMLRR